MTEAKIEIYKSEEARWKMQLVADDDLVFHLVKGPSWFHRLMQRLILGIVWTPIRRMNEAEANSGRIL